MPPKNTCAPLTLRSSVRVGVYTGVSTTSCPFASSSAASALSRRRVPQYIVPAPPVNDRIRIDSPRGASPLGLPYTLSREPLRRLAPFAWLASLRSLAASRARRPSLCSLEYSFARPLATQRQQPQRNRIRVSIFLPPVVFTT